MISICIPVYNYEVSNLTTTLAKQMKLLDLNIEIIVIDDGSGEGYVLKNRNNLECCNYIELPKNVGRSKIRNLFTQYAKHENLLFLDCDVEIVSSKFIENYIESIKNNQFDVICGGLVYADTSPLRTHNLRWEYGSKRECRSVEERSENPYGSFMTSNFLIKREVFQRFPFDESIIQYGHEDTLLGFDLKKASKKIIHINNPVLHADKETNENFILKTEKATQNLLHILESQTEKKDFSNSIKLLNYVEKVHKYKMSLFVLVFFKIIKNYIRKCLLKGELFNLTYFDFYKLGVFLEYEKQNSKSV